VSVGLTCGRSSVSLWITCNLPTGQGAETDQKVSVGVHSRAILCIKSVTRVQSCASNGRPAPEPLYRLTAGELPKANPRPFLRMDGHEARSDLCIVWRDRRPFLCIAAHPTRVCSSESLSARVKAALASISLHGPIRPGARAVGREPPYRQWPRSRSGVGSLPFAR
jgi:hypothetical protein